LFRPVLNKVELVQWRQVGIVAAEACALLNPKLPSLMLKRERARKTKVART